MKVDKMMNSLTKIIGLGVLSVGLQANVWADEKPAEMSVGIGAFYVKAPYAQWDGDEITPIPYFTYKKGDFYIDGTGVGYNVLLKENGNTGFYIDVIGSAQVGLGYKNEDSVVLNGMDDRDDIAIELGVKFGHFSEFGLVEFTAVQDVASAHEGFVAEATYSLPLGDESQGIQVVPYFGLSYQSEDFNQYFYGVEQHEARVGRSAYQAEGDVNTFGGLSVIYQLTPKWTLTMNAEYEKLGDEAVDSPIVAEDNVISGFIGINYAL